VTARWHRGDRVVHIPTQRQGVVEGWKGDAVLVWWGSLDRRPIRDWVPAAETVLTDGYQPGWPE